MTQPTLKATLVAATTLLALWGPAPAAAADAEDLLGDLKPMETQRLTEETGKNTVDSFNVDDSYNYLQSNTSDSDVLQVGNIIAGNGPTGAIGGNSVSNTSGITTLMQSTGHGNAQIYTMNVNVTLQ